LLSNSAAANSWAAWLDSAILAQAGIPAVIFGPSGDGAHAAVEYVDVESVITTTTVLVESIIDFCKEILQ